MTKSSYVTKKGAVMVQLNVSVRIDIADKFTELCDGVSKSAVFTQLVKEAYAKKVMADYGVQPAAVPTRKPYSILGNN